jgi:hypothetical protein
MHIIAGQTPYWYDYEVKLNGITLTGVIEVDTEKGLLVRYKFNKDGKPVLKEEDDFGLIHQECTGTTYEIERIENLTGLTVHKTR